MAALRSATTDQRFETNAPVPPPGPLALPPNGGITQPAAAKTIVAAT
ncbi:MAG: hypothetical protein ACOH2N_18340 [Devosia sp.]